MTRRRLLRSGWIIAIPTALGLSSLAEAQPASREVQVAQAGVAEPKLLGTYDALGAYTGTSGGKKVCFALSKPSSSQTNPPNRPRDPPYMFISTRPSENVRNEVSIIIGYGFKPNTDATVEIGSATFSMYTQNDGAWIKNAAEEARMVEAMRKNGDLVVKGTSARGTQTTDTFSLKGLDQALTRIAQECK